ncbi:MAG: hypothetical protein MSH15_12520 [Oscillospiraceae bacterium]|nr:hypothetical protein [Oscillospiraceae bacterium]
MKKLFVSSVILSCIFLCGCNKKEVLELPADDTAETLSVPHKLSEYYEREEYDISEYIAVDDIAFTDDGTYISGLKLSEEKRVINVLDTGKNEMYQINLNFSFDWIDNVCILGDRTYILHDSCSVTIVETEIGRLINQKTDFIYARDIQYDGRNIVLVNQSEGIITFWDTEMNFISELSVKSLLDVPDNGFMMYRILQTEKYLYVTVQSEKSADIYILDSENNIVSQKNISDLPGYIYSVYENEDSVIISSYDSSDDRKLCSYVDVININNGTVESTYEIDGAQFVMYNYSDGNFIGLNNESAFTYSSATESYDQLGESDGYQNGDIKQSGKNIIFCPEIGGNLNQVFSYISLSGEKNDILIDKNIRKKGVISNGRFYCNYESQDTGDTALSVYDREGNIVLDIELDKEADDMTDYYPACCTPERIYSVSCDITDDNNILNIYNMSGEKISEYPVDDIGYLYNIVSGASGDFAWILKGDKSEVYRLTDERAVKLEKFCGINPYYIYSGDSKYDFYYVAGTTLYGYTDAGSESERILNFVDSGISDISEIFMKTSEDRYLCSKNGAEGTQYYILSKASDEVLEQMNSRKILVAAGDCSWWENKISDIITEFNAGNKEMFITCRDYSDSSENDEISALNRDVINGDVPDIFISYGGLDMNALENMGMFEDLSGYLSDYSDKFISGYYNVKKDGGFYSVSPSIEFSVISSTEECGINGPMVTTEDFLSCAREKNLGFKNSREEIFRYFVLSQADSYISKEEKTCDFDSEQFTELMEYIKSAEDENGTLMIEYFCDTFLIGRKLKNSFSVSRDGNSSGIITELPRISVSSSSEYKKEACDLIKTFLSGDFQSKVDFRIPVIQEYAFPSARLNDSERESVMNMFENAVSESETDFSVQNILIQNAEKYFSGYVDVHEMADSIQNQIKLYLNERYE